MVHDRLYFEKKKLKNGATLWAHHMDVPFTHIRIVIPVGSVHSHTGNQGGAPGIAHFLEHMLMERSLQYPEKGSFERELSHAGGDWNACTTPFYTDFFLHAPATDIERLARGFISQVYEPSFAEEDIQIQSSIVRNERELDKYYPGATEIDQHKFHSWMRTRFYPKEQLFGTEDSLSTFSVEQLREFHKHYRTRETHILLGGSITPALVELFETIELNDVPRLQASVEEAGWAQREFRTASSKDLDVPLFSWGGIFSESDMHSFWGITLIAEMLTNQNEGMLTSWLRKEKGWSYSVSSAQWFDRDRMGWTIDAPINDVAVIPELQNLLPEKVTEALTSVAFLRGTIERVVKSNCFSFQRLTERMDFGVEYLASFGSIPTEADYLDWLRGVTNADLKNVYEKYYSPEKTGQLLLMPE